jgi:Flagellar assembly protein FliH
MNTASKRPSPIVKIAPVAWTKRNTLKSVARPSWIGRLVIPAPQSGIELTGMGFTGSSPPPKLRSSIAVPGHSEPPRSSRPSLAALARAVKSIPPQMIQTTREVELTSEVDVLRNEVAKLAQLIATLRAKIVEESEPEILRFCVSIADRIVAREIAQDPTIIIDWIREGLTAMPGRDEIVVAVAPDIAQLMPSLADSTGTKVIVDPSLHKGSCEVREGATTAEISAAARIAAIADALGCLNEQTDDNNESTGVEQ